MYRIISTFFSSMVNRYWLLATQSNLTCVCAALRSHSLFLSLFRSRCVRVTCVSNRIYVYWTEQNCPLLLVNSVLLSMGFFLARSSLFSSPTVLDNALFLDARYIFFFRWHCFLLYGYVLHTYVNLMVFCVVWLLIATISWNNKLFSMCKRLRWKLSGRSSCERSEWEWENNGRAQLQSK